jgi:exosome complex component RRP40
MTQISEIVQVGAACLPGEPVLSLTAGATVVIGAGLKQRLAPSTGSSSSAATAVVVATISGTVTRTVVHNDGADVAKYHVVSPSAKRYHPRRGDAVVGVITRAIGMSYSLHIGAPHTATLDGLAFDGATKANKPKLAVGDVVYCHVLTADRDVDVELSCCAPRGTEAKDWVTGEGAYGPLRGGAVVSVPLQYAADLLHNTVPVLMQLGERVAFESAIGLNGRVWLSTPQGQTKQLVGVTRCVVECRDDVEAGEVTERVQRYFPSAL